MKNRNFVIFFMTVVVSSFPALAQTKVSVDDNEPDSSQKVLDACLANASVIARSEQTIGQLRTECLERSKGKLISDRNILEKRVASNPFAILPHRQNYILPFTYSEADNEIYADRLQGRTLDDVEAEFQLSIKYLAAVDIFTEGLDMEFAFTSVSWWQAYNSQISAPFRETNYEPELIFRNNNPWSLFGLAVKSSHLSINHQSNGQAGLLSRSWNRIIGGLAIEHNNLVWGAELWWRLPEDEKDNPLSPKGDDNPDIEKFVGQGQIGVLWKSNSNHNLQLQIRNNLRSKNRGSVKMGWSFPFSDRLRGYVQLFNGYGESLVSYNKNTSRIGVGVMLTDWL